jgi:nicotinamidase-related amidase
MWIALPIIVLLALVASVGARVAWLATPTSGAPIIAYPTPGVALVVLDIQNDTLQLGYSNPDAVLSQINQVITSADGQGVPVAYVRQVLANPIDRALTGGRYAPGTPGAELAAMLTQTGSNVFEKARSDAFSNPDFEGFLVAHQVSTLVLVGADASACVRTTALGALNRHYQVTVITDATFSITPTSGTKAYNDLQTAGATLTTWTDFPGWIT